ncbi:MAG TPA: invasion associated locus B family protein [Kiloniellales bacterium]|nr:invasion associated locus B family protein [Kiloniellales bacterium]
MARWLVRSFLAVTLCLGLVTAAAAQDDLERIPIEDWTLRCTKAEPPRCDLRQRVVNDQGKQILDFGMGYNAADQTFPVVLELPLGILVQQQIRFKVEEIEFGGMKVNRCLPTGCIVEAVAPVEMIDAMRKGQQGAVIVPLPDGKFAALVVSLRGFTAAAAELIQRNSRT